MSTTAHTGKLAGLRVHSLAGPGGRARPDIGIYCQARAGVSAGGDQGRARAGGSRAMITAVVTTHLVNTSLPPTRHGRSGRDDVGGITEEGEIRSFGSRVMVTLVWTTHTQSVLLRLRSDRTIWSM